ncbi:MAG TPA: hypothetical protein VHY33_06760 [Thermoanaerobaculia bacterium]|nr:hypothetical protein [Thermoanaerobaculia bacterium]
MSIDVPVIGSRDRSLSGWLLSLGIRLVSFFAQVSDSGAGETRRSSHEDAAQATPCNTTGNCTRVRCCCLACATVECPYPGSNKADFTCPGGYKTFWTCTDGTAKIGCGECAGGPSSCYVKPWYCSIWWQIN